MVLISLVVWVSCRDCSQNPGNSRYCPGREVHALANRAGHAVITMCPGNELSRQRTVPATNCPGNELSRQRTVPALVVQHRTSIGVSGDFFDKGDPEPFAIYWPLDHEKRRVIVPG